MALYLRSQNQILADVEALMRDTGNARWTDAEIYRALNLALQDWWGRVQIPMLYTGISSWTAGTYEYALPAYVREPMRAQMERTVSEYPSTWVDVPGFRVEPSSSGAYYLRFDTVPYSADARILFWANNSAVPTTVPTLTAEIDADDTSLTLTTTADVQDVGYVKIEGEWLQYAGMTTTATTVTLTNLVRAQNGTAAAIHALGTSVYWGVAVDDMRLFTQLINQIGSIMHRMFLTDGSEREHAHHERLMSYYDSRVQEFWMRYSPSYRPRMRLTRQGTMLE